MKLSQPSIVAYLRKRNNGVLSHCCSSAKVIEPREPHICNSITKIWLQCEGKNYKNLKLTALNHQKQNIRICWTRGPRSTAFGPHSVWGSPVEGIWSKARLVYDRSVITCAVSLYEVRSAVNRKCGVLSFVALRFITCPSAADNFNTFNMFKYEYIYLYLLQCSALQSIRSDIHVSWTVFSLDSKQGSSLMTYYGGTGKFHSYYFCNLKLNISVFLFSLLFTQLYSFSELTVLFH
jgi:hypothetical protein